MPRKTKKTPLQLKKEQLWELCKQVIRKRDGDTCITCGARGLTGGNQQTGHCIPSSVCGALLRYDLRNLSVQCLSCNYHRGGMGAVYIRELERRYGREWVDRLYADKNVSIKADILFLDDKVREYQRYLEMSKRELLEITKGL